MYSLHTWQTQDELPQNAANAIMQTGDGYLWIGTLTLIARGKSHRKDEP